MLLLMPIAERPIDKPDLLAAMQEKFGLRYEITAATVRVNATEGKTCYYSLNTRAADFGYQPSLTSLEGILQESGENSESSNDRNE